MKKRRFSAVAIFAISLLMISSVSLAATSANILYKETELGNGLWQYDYIFSNNSTSGDYLYSVLFSFSALTTISELTVTTGWDSSLTGFMPIDNDYIDYYSTDPAYDIAAGGSLGGFSFTADGQVGSVSFTSGLDDYNGNQSLVSGTAALAPEPLSSLLFLSGGAALMARRRSRITG
jgi:hypothetical protein